MATTVIGTREIRPVRFWESTNGQKAMMAVSGLILFLFVVFHMIGNLQVFEGPEQLNFYGAALRRFPEALWGARVVLLAAVALHIWSSVKLAVRKTNARPVAYAQRRNTVSSYASRTMYWSGPILLAFIIYHIYCISRSGTFIPITGSLKAMSTGISSLAFKSGMCLLWYILSMILLGLHIRHGAWSMFQSLGLNHPRHTPILRKAAAAFAIIIVAGYISIPISVMLGFVK